MGNDLFKVEYVNYDKDIYVTNYAECIVYDIKTNQLVLIYYGGYGETVKAMADAINSGGGIKVHTETHIMNLNSVVKAYKKNIKKDNPYAKCLILRKDDENCIINANEDNEEEEGNILRKSYLFIKDKNKKQLFKEINKRTSIPMLEEYADYVIEKMQEEEILYQLECLSNTNIIDAYCMIRDDNTMQKIVETGLKEGHLKISDIKPKEKGFLDISDINTYLSKFGQEIAEKIKKSFIPLFDPTKEQISKEVEEIDDYLYQTRGIRLYSAQKIIAESIKRKLEKDKCVVLCAECGSGKTVIANTSLHSLYKNKKEKHFGVILGPSHLGEKWVREVEWTIPNSKAFIAQTITELNKAYEYYTENRVTVYVFISKERARDGYMKKPAILWSNTKKCFICPDCFARQEMELTDDGIKYMVDADCFYYRNENSANRKCKNCNSLLWTAVNPSDRRYNKWAKVSPYGWIYRPMAKHYLKEVEDENILEKLTDTFVKTGYIPTKSAYRKYGLSTYMKKKMKHLVDSCILDELHLYKGDTGQGIAAGELAKMSEKVIAMTATLINGYSSSIFYILFRCFPSLMVKEGYEYYDQRAFNKEYGVFQEEYKLKEARYNAGSRAVKRKLREKLLPGVSPLVFTRYLLDNAVFLSLDDMTDSMPEYEEIPIIMKMNDEVANEYERIEGELKSILKSERKISHKILGNYLITLTLYPDMPYGMKPIYNPEDGSELVVPKNVGSPDELYEKELKILEIAEEKISKGEKLLVYTNWVNTDTQKKLQRILIEKGYRTKILSSSTQASKREAWLMKNVNDIDVLITNPSLVETGLDLNEFTNIIFYNVAYNLNTFRQSSRRSWRINQTSPRVEVYIFAYEGTMQHRAIRLMGTKLAVATTIEGNVTSEGLAALNDCEDLTTALARELASGISANVEDVSAIYKKMAILNTKKQVQTKDKNIPVKDMQLGITEKEQNDITINIIDTLKIEETQLKLLFKIPKQKKKSTKKKVMEGQLDLFSDVLNKVA